VDERGFLGSFLATDLVTKSEFCSDKMAAPRVPQS
jgi:hypothetical protein